ncbi:MAG: hypothetical protein M3536_03465 [Actinomycetota bacterium]|nr:hypothetical protein [Actinomycetota bacterium]
MADIAAVMGRLNGDELSELRELGPQGHLPRHLVDAVDRAAGGRGAGRGYYVPTGSVSATGGPHLALRSDVSDWLFGHAHRAMHPGGEPVAGAVEEVVANDWTDLRPGDKVSVLGGGKVLATGTVDDITADASIVWVACDGVSGRRMFHREEPEQIRPVRAADMAG